MVINPSKMADTVGASVVIFSGTGSNEVAEGAFVVKNPGEYEVKGVRIYGFADDEQTLYSLQVDDVHLAHLASRTRELTKEMAEEFNTVNILFVSADQDPSDLVSQLEPNIVVPLNLTPTTEAKLKKEMGEEAVEKTAKLVVKGFGEEEETRVVILS